MLIIFEWKDFKAEIEKQNIVNHINLSKGWLMALSISSMSSIRFTNIEAYAAATSISPKASILTFSFASESS